MDFWSDLVGQAYQKENQKAIKFNDFYLSIIMQVIHNFVTS